MPKPDYREVDPRELRLPSPRFDGADPAKLQRQLSQYGRATDGMPPPQVYEAPDGVFVVYNGVTRATRVAMLSPGIKIRVEVVGQLRKPRAMSPKIGDKLP